MSLEENSSKPDHGIKKQSVWDREFGTASVRGIDVVPLGLED